MRAGGVLLLFLLLACSKEPVRTEPARPPSASAAPLASASAPAPAESASVAIVDAGPPKCPPGIDGGVIDFVVKRELLPAKPPDREKPVMGIVLTAPTLAFRLELVSIPAPMSCGTSILAAAQRMSVSCTFSPGSFTFEVRREPDRITFTETGHEVGEGSRGPTEFHAPVLIPCGTRLAFRHFEFRDPKWVAFGPACQNRCFDQHWTCKRPCLTNLTDESGELTEAGQACDTKCSDALQKCNARCPTP